MVSPKVLSIALVVVASTSTLVAGPQPQPTSLTALTRPTRLTGLTGPAGPISDHPTSCVSLPDRLTLYHVWPKGDEGTKKFLVVVPPAENLEPEVLEAEIEQTSRAQARTTDTISNLAIWLKAHPEGRGQIFLSQPIGYVRHYRIVELQVTPVLRNNDASYRIRRMRWTYRWKSPYRPPSGFSDEATR
ncbi:hypothetical protein FJY63_15135, partial [Candidatus Sumerlaeota bacterium]|nr:hypothetical protein [Candidatus Sumerlaeota bacterium]